jgi:hypothetical protein
MYQVYEVELAHKADALLKHYRAEFEKRYRAQPYTEEKDEEICRWAVQAFKDGATDLVSEYLVMSDDWFLTQSHSLQCFKKNVNRVIGRRGKKSPAKRISHGIRTMVSCDKCHKHYWLTTSVSNLNDPKYDRLCDACSE